MIEAFRVHIYIRIVSQILQLSLRQLIRSVFLPPFRCRMRHLTIGRE